MNIEMVVQIQQALPRIFNQADSLDKKLLAICQLLHDKVDYYHWVGFYFTDSENKSELVLKIYVGAPTEHVRIPFGRGICGQAAALKHTFVVQDVSQESNYLACSSLVKAEIVVPIIKNGQVLGELDIDSHKASPFDKNDHTLLEEICQKIVLLIN
jgi:L-methionine (R)-S-oxide reductase